jgi:hypothetical protein
MFAVTVPETGCVTAEPSTFRADAAVTVAVFVPSLIFVV